MPLEATPDTTAYLIAGYAVIFGFMKLWIFSVIVRKRNLEQDLRMIEEIEKK